jgi:hypothetical protein
MLEGREAGMPESYCMTKAFEDFSFQAFCNKKSHLDLSVGMAFA